MINNIIILTKKDKNTKKALVIKNINETIIAKGLSTINFDDKHNKIIINSNINITKDLKLIYIQK